MNESDFITKVVIPVKQSSELCDDSWLLKDREMKILSLSPVIMSKLDNKSLARKCIGKKITSYLDFENNNDRQKYTNAHRMSVLSQRAVTISVLLKSKVEIEIVLITMIPILFESKVVAVEDYIFKYGAISLSLMESISRIPEKSNLLNVEKKYYYSKKYLSVIYFLILGKKQKEIARLLGVTRVRVTQIIEKICAEVGVYGWSSKLLKYKALFLNYHRNIPARFLVSLVEAGGGKR